MLLIVCLPVPIVLTAEDVPLCLPAEIQGESVCARCQSLFWVLFGRKFPKLAGPENPVVFDTLSGNPGVVYSALLRQ